MNKKILKQKLLNIKKQLDNIQLEEDIKRIPVLENIGSIKKQADRIKNGSVHVIKKIKQKYGIDCTKIVKKIKPKIEQTVKKAVLSIAITQDDDVLADGKEVENIDENESKDVASRLYRFVDDIFGMVALEVKNKSNASLTRKVFYALSLLISVIVLSLLSQVIVAIGFTVISKIFNWGFSKFNRSLTYVAGALLAPFIEEWGKMKSIEGGFGDEYLHIFTWSEFTEYMSMGYIMAREGFNVSLLAVFKARLLAVAMHYTTGYIMKYRDSLGITKGQSYVIGLFIHGTWNFFGILLNKEISKLLQ